LRELQESNESDLEFSYYVKLFEGAELVLAFDFMNKRKVSQSPIGQDKVQITWMDGEETFDLNPVIEETDEQIEKQEAIINGAGSTTNGLSVLAYI
jgi:hypothetical protein